MVFRGLYRVDDAGEHKETRKSPCAAFQGEAAASHRGHCKKTTQVFSLREKMKICGFPDEEVFTKTAKVDKVCEETFYELSFIKLRPSWVNVI